MELESFGCNKIKIKASKVDKMTAYDLTLDPYCNL